jgi:predicted dehydrogenase
MPLAMKILIVGNGSMGSRHFQLSKKLFPYANVKILVRQKPSEHLNFLENYIETMEQVEDFAPQIAIIANPATFHIDIAQKLAEAGVHLLIEKPISTSKDGVVKLIETCKNNGVVLMTGYALRFSSSLLHFRQLVKSKILGETLSVRCEVGQYLPDWRPNKDYRMTVSANSHLGGGVVLELSHEIDYLRWIFGEIDWVRATLSRQSSLEIDVEDTAHLILGFKPNSHGKQLIANLNLDFIRHDRTRSCTVIGETGTLRWDGLTGTVDIYKQNSQNWEVLFNHHPDTDKALIAEWKNFIMTVDKKGELIVTGEDGLRVVEIIEAAQKSAATGYQEKVAKTPSSIVTT